ncbi:MAG: SDR family NAD(P)-dependent oxidoreductase [Acidobacteriota bacterium]|jgi:short-subunit dehydrogenase|nr:SDR family NAD(P)-dependent oxidoreductase [Acidobacteriota bacterium]
MSVMGLAGRLIVVTGASSGLGRALAVELAEREGAHLLICARREDRLRMLQADILARTGARVQVLRTDLSRATERRALLDTLAQDETVFGLINNAGMTRYGPMVFADIDEFHAVMELNLTAVVELSLGFVEILKRRGEGFLLNVTSEAAFVPTPYQGFYSATKHGVQAFTDALRMEYRRSPFFIGTFVPGGIRTDMITSSGLDRRIPRDSRVNMTAEKAAAACVRGLKRRRALTVPGMLNRINHALTRLLPREWVLRAAERLYRPPADGNGSG